MIVIFSFLFANLSIFRRLENFFRKNFMLKCNFDIAIFNISFHREKSRKKCLFLPKNLLDWCKSGKKKKRTSPIGEGDNYGCGCRRKSHRKSQ
ncbi:hypothetical protein E5355_11525 [Bacteroides muris (ex Afrizal et al. 2022)]|uniref:Uncharacterized protein n=1 Tax=Bacteroides muris (ex Afrizal et al. 2022) TaxID=2516960 RepID=A0A4S2ARG2_9BACE|nr:hypothetical protein E5355_11525 [Bacteroides muris (ex Afrizal et al. 2022)]